MKKAMATILASALVVSSLGGCSNSSSTTSTTAPTTPEASAETTTSLTDMGNERILHDFPAFGESVGDAINNGALLDFTKELGRRLQEMELYKACLLSNLIGFACEKEGDTSAGPDIVALFATACSKVYQMLQSTASESENQIPSDLTDIYREHPDWVGAYYGFRTICISAMAFLTRDPGLRKLLSDRNIAQELEYLTEDAPESPYLDSVSYVRDMLSTCSGLKLLVIQPGKKQGFLATANDLNNCFHLLFLLEEQIADKLGGKYGMSVFRADKELTALAHGAYPENCWDKTYSTYFMECNYSAALHTKFENADANALIWGEMMPDAIPSIDGRRIIVLLENGIRRSFDAPFLAVGHSALSPAVEIERELTDEEYCVWLDNIRHQLAAMQ